MALWRDRVVRSGAVVAEVLSDGGLGTLSRRAWPDGGAPSLRRLLIDLIEECARHVGHADFVRESVAASSGETPPVLTGPLPGEPRGQPSRRPQQRPPPDTPVQRSGSRCFRGQPEGRPLYGSVRRTVGGRNRCYAADRQVRP